jgi:hypothetical protein
MQSKKKRQTSRDRSGKVTSVTSKGERADDFVDPDDKKISKGLSGLATALGKNKPDTETQAEGVEKAKPTPTPTPEPPPPEPTPTPEVKDAKPKRSDYDDGTEYMNALRAWKKRNPS